MTNVLLGQEDGEGWRGEILDGDALSSRVRPRHMGFANNELTNDASITSPTTSRAIESPSAIQWWMASTATRTRSGLRPRITTSAPAGASCSQME